MRISTFDSLPAEVQKEARLEGINFNTDRVVIFRYGEEAKKMGYVDESNKDFYGTSPQENLPGKYLQVRQ